MKSLNLALRPAAVFFVVLLSACGGASAPEDIYEAAKEGCITHFKEERPLFKADVIAFDAWEKNGKVIIEFGTEVETGKGKLKKTTRTVVDQCYYDRETEIYRLPSKFENVTSRDGTPVMRTSLAPKTEAGAE